MFMKTSGGTASDNDCWKKQSPRAVAGNNSSGRADLRTQRAEFEIVRSPRLRTLGIFSRGRATRRRKAGPYCSRITLSSARQPPRKLSGSGFCRNDVACRRAAGALLQGLPQLDADTDALSAGADSFGASKNPGQIFDAASGRAAPDLSFFENLLRIDS